MARYQTNKGDADVQHTIKLMLRKQVEMIEFMNKLERKMMLIAERLHRLEKERQVG